MLKGKTESGFEFEIDEDVLNDYYFCKAIGEAEENPTKIYKVIELFFGKDSQRAINYVEEQTGKTSVADVTKLFKEATEAIALAKKS